MNIIESYIVNNPNYRSPRYITPKGIMLHGVGCPQPKGSVFVNNYNKSTCGVSVHGFIDATNGDFYKTMPFNYRAGHCGGSANNTHIAIEMCEPSYIKYTNGASFVCTNLSKAREQATTAYNSAVELFAMICEEYNFDPMTDIISHNEGRVKGIASAHYDPEHLWNGLGLGFTMDGFRQDVKNAMKKDEWKHNDKGYWYEYADGTYPKSKWLKLDNEWYYFDDRGYAYRNKWLEYKDKWYYFGDDCKMLSDSWVNYKQKTYYIDSNGVMVIGLKKIGKDLYYFAEDGHMCHTNPSGALV